MTASNLKVKLVIGLGNPEKKYQSTYHNFGYLFIDYLKSHLQNLTGHMLKSNVYMNQSGQFVKSALKKAGPKPESLLVTQDDSDIVLGSYKLSFGRGAAGHHGIESIIQTLGTQNFWRLRIGIRPTEKNKGQKVRRLKAGEFVLKKITPAHQKILELEFPKILTHLKKLI